MDWRLLVVLPLAAAAPLCSKVSPDPPPLSEAMVTKATQHLSCEAEATIARPELFVVAQLTSQKETALELHLQATITVLNDSEPTGQPCTDCAKKTPPVEVQLSTRITGRYESFGTMDVQRGSSQSASMLCFPQSGRQNLSMLLAASERTRLRMDLAARAHPQERDRGNWTVQLGSGPRSPAELLSFDISDPFATFERIAFQAKQANALEAEAVTHVYVFPASNGCIAEPLQDGQCVAPDDIGNCISHFYVAFDAHDNLAGGAHHFSFRKGTVLTLTTNGVMKPRRALGRWYMLLICAPHIRGGSCPDVDIEVRQEPERSIDKQLLMGALLMLLAPMLMLFAVDFAYFWAHKVLLATTGYDDMERIWPAFGGMPRRRCIKIFCKNLGVLLASPRPYFGTLMAIVLLIFLATGGQFVAMHFWLRERSGNHNICLYNEKCYYPGPWDIPVNHMLSHIGYFVAAFHVIGQAAFADCHCQSLVNADETKGLRPIDVRAFYAVAATFIGEGIGSMSYHLCPSVETFQFDTCFMIPIAHLLCVVLLDWTDQALHSVAVIKYFLYIIAPIWCFNAIGTWYDVGIFDNRSVYGVVHVCLMIWAVIAVQGFGRLFPQPGRCSRVLKRGLQFFVVFALSLTSVPQVRIPLGGMANSFLLVSVAVMIVTVSWQIYMEEIRFQNGCTSLSACAQILIKYFYWLIMVIVMVVSLMFFMDKVVRVAPHISAETSFDANKPCAISVFDFHDLWHTFSAVALALFTMMLLDIKVHAWARKNGVKVIREIPCDEYDSISSDDSESWISNGDG